LKGGARIPSYSIFNFLRTLAVNPSAFQDAANPRALGLSDLEIELIRQKKRMIEKLKVARLKKGISQAALAERVGSKQPAIARMESGQVSEVSMDFLTKVALTLEVTVTIRAIGEAAWGSLRLRTTTEPAPGTPANQKLERLPQWQRRRPWTPRIA